MITLSQPAAATTTTTYQVHTRFLSVTLNQKLYLLSVMHLPVCYQSYCRGIIGRLHMTWQCWRSGWVCSHGWKGWKARTERTALNCCWETISFCSRQTGVGLRRRVWKLIIRSIRNPERFKGQQYDDLDWNSGRKQYMWFMLDTRETQWAWFLIPHTVTWKNKTY